MPTPAVAKEAIIPSASRKTGAIRSKAVSMREKVMVVSVSSSVCGPGGAGLHSSEEHVRLDDVMRCRDALVELARAFTASRT